ncbi:DUF2141 domain-containing protein [Teredinibacter purpureus]|uniref:DUF2141 domain-containing protein n=1 Tax=Teredinibacter purpureus TaxID=2731756 RepID=UPI0009E5EF9A|nr:DUF2141 domain-containing protein [Teredinibacter purpureus]
MDKTDVSLKVDNIDSSRHGNVVVFVFGEEGFPKEHAKAVTRYVFAAETSTHTLTISVPKAREFAIKVHHDEDDSGTVTKNWTGIIPAEGLGFSSGAKIRLGPPSFKSAKMTSPASGKISIPLRYRHP